MAVDHGYTYTRPRGPICAMFNSPGPVHALPTLTGFMGHDPRSVHRLAPAWIIAAKLSKRFDRPGPGPAGYLPDPKMLNSGWDGAPHWSLGMLVKPLVPFNVPGPPHYRTEDVTANAYQAPSWSIRKYCKGIPLDNYPAPNAYTLDPMIGPVTYRTHVIQAPSYSFGQRFHHGSFFYDRAKTPGPAAYEVGRLELYKSSAPEYSLQSKHYPPCFPLSVPGPGAHPSHLIWVHKPAAPHFSFGMYHSPYLTPCITHADVCLD